MCSTKVSQNSGQMGPDSHETDDDSAVNSLNQRCKTTWWAYLSAHIPPALKERFNSFDRSVDGAASFFLKHAGKSRFMIAMSKKAQYLGIEQLWYKGPKAFIYFFLFYLLRDTILYIVIPIFFAKVTS